MHRLLWLVLGWWLGLLTAVLIGRAVIRRDAALARRARPDQWP